MNLEVKRLKEICDWYAAIDASKIDQSKANCCFGGHLAKLLLSYDYDYKEGAKAFAREVGTNLAYVYVMFRSIGIRNPFGSFSWEIPHDEAMRKLSLIEELPSLVGADLQGVDLENVNLREADLRLADLRKTDLREADLHKTDLRGAKLTEADLRRANLSEADLRLADIREADLEGANLREADLDGANIRRANLFTANLTGAKLPK